MRKRVIETVACQNRLGMQQTALKLVKVEKQRRWEMGNKTVPGQKGTDEKRMTKMASDQYWPDPAARKRTKSTQKWVKVNEQNACATIWGWHVHVPVEMRCHGSWDSKCITIVSSAGNCTFRPFTPKSMANRCSIGRCATGCVRVVRSSRRRWKTGKQMKRSIGKEKSNDRLVHTEFDQFKV